MPQFDDACRQVGRKAHADRGECFAKRLHPRQSAVVPDHGAEIDAFVSKHCEICRKIAIDHLRDRGIGELEGNDFAVEVRRHLDPGVRERRTEGFRPGAGVVVAEGLGQVDVGAEVNLVIGREMLVQDGANGGRHDVLSCVVGRCWGCEGPVILVHDFGHERRIVDRDAHEAVRLLWRGRRATAAGKSGDS